VAVVKEFFSGFRANAAPRSFLGGEECRFFSLENRFKPDSLSAIVGMDRQVPHTPNNFRP
jgi:hypothetical protein